jgi:hypothetical protein
LAPDVVEGGGSADVAAQHGQVLVAGDVGDLALLDARAGGGGGVAGAQRAAGEQVSRDPGLMGAARQLGDRLVGEAALADPVAPVHAPKDGPALELSPSSQRRSARTAQRPGERA